jgi:transcriptional antiterminator RfaH
MKCCNLWRDINWFALHTKPRRESFAATNVSALGVETFLPWLKAERLICGVARMSVKPLFPGYFFARFCPEGFFESVKCSRGVLQVVGSGRFPTPVDDEVVHEIRNRAEADGFVRVCPHALVAGTRVSIQSGPFEGMIGRVERELNDRKRVAILLESLLYARVQIEKTCLDAEAA